MSRAQALLIAVACLLAAAYAARRIGPALSADARASRPGTAIAPLPAHGILAQAERLRARLASPPAYRAPARNPFQFREPPPARQAVGKSAAPAPTTDAADRVERPEMKLVGIAEDSGPDGVVRRTIIVSAMMQLFFAKEGDRVLGRYEVVRITADAARLKGPDGESFTLALR
jgi:hypothetical protein